VECGSCHCEFPRHPGPGRPALYCSARCARRAKAARARRRQAQAVRAWYQAVAAGELEDDFITREWARGLLDWQAGLAYPEWR
jgi:hypothetical protein